MIHRIIIIFSAVLLAGIANVRAEHQTWTVHPDGSQANAGAGTESEATGAFLFDYDSESGLLMIDGIHNVENVTVAHVHRAPRGENGGVIFGFENPASPIHAEWNITEEQMAELVEGNYYVNVHSQAFAGGEIRGQIEKTTSDLYEPISFTIYVQPWQRGLEGPTAGMPVGAYMIGLGMGRDVAVINWEQGIENATAAHIHAGAAGQNGAPIFQLGTEMEGRKVWFPTADEVTQLLSGGLYVNIHTEEFADGAARGQIIQNIFDYGPDSMLDFDATGAQADGGDGTGSEAMGRFVCLLNEAGNTMTIYGTHNVENVTAAHIHRAPPDENGPVVFGFSSGASPISARWIMSAQDIDALEAGNLYVNIHSQAFPGGEIRGRLEGTHGEPESGFMILVTLDGQQADAGNGVETFASGFGELVVRNDDYPFIYFAGIHTTAFPTASHIHSGRPDQNGGVMLGLNLNLTSIDGAWFPDGENLAEILANRSYVNIHTPSHPGGEIRGNITIEEESVNDGETGRTPQNYELSSAYPNPFNSSVRLSAVLPFGGIVELGVFDIAGREVSRLVDGELPAGRHEFVWNAEASPAGTYFARMTAGRVTRTATLILAK